MILSRISIVFAKCMVALNTTSPPPPFTRFFKNMVNNEYTDAHRLFLQASLSERFFTEATAIEIYRKAYEATAGIYLNI